MTINRFEESFYKKIETNIDKIKRKINIAAEKYKKNPNEINLMAVTKNVKSEYVNHAINCNINILGENRVQELKKKYEKYKKGVKINFIGHLQRNKVKDIINIVDSIDSVDSLKLAVAISKEAKKIGKIMPILLEVNIAKEKSKYGFYPEEIVDAVNKICRIPNIKIRGLMTIPPKENVINYFKQMQTIYIDISNKKIDNVDMQFLSMGMSGDFEKAISFGANIVRIGSLIFGDR